MILRTLLIINLLIFNVSCKKEIKKEKVERFFKVSSIIYFNKKKVFSPVILLNLNDSIIKVTIHHKKEMRYSIKLQKDKDYKNKFLLYARIKYKNRNSDVLFSLEENKEEKVILYTKRGDTLMIKIKIEMILYKRVLDDELDRVDEQLLFNKELSNYQFNTFNRNLILKKKDEI